MMWKWLPLTPSSVSVLITLVGIFKDENSFKVLQSTTWRKNVTNVLIIGSKNAADHNVFVNDSFVVAMAATTR
jgi:hypothetical protein